MAGTLWKLTGTGAAVVAGIATRKGLTTSWVAATGKEPPVNPEDPEVQWREAVAWAVLSGAAIGVARLLVARKLAQVWTQKSGSRPEDLHAVQP